MSDIRPIRNALISVFHKEGLEEILKVLGSHNVTLYSTGGSLDYINSLGLKGEPVEDLTGYPSILDGRVKTLHPKIFGGILARREQDHLSQLEQYEIPPIDLVIVDLYPFEKTVKSTNDEKLIIEKIDIGGISLIRAAAKNYQDVVIVPSQDSYPAFLELLKTQGAQTTLADRKNLAAKAFDVSSHYDQKIHAYFAGEENDTFKVSYPAGESLRYGENPHQQARFYGDMTENFIKLHGKELSFNNLVDVDAAIALMREFRNNAPTFAILKHTNVCGISTRPIISEAWDAALAGDPVSAFGGVLISNSPIDEATAKKIDVLFYEVLIAPSFTKEALDILKTKKTRILLELTNYPSTKKQVKSILDGYLVQDQDQMTEGEDQLRSVSNRKPTEKEIADLLFANKCVKHLKSNSIAIVREQQLLGMGSGQTSRVDALRQAILKAHTFGFTTENAVMASEAFFPFPDCVQIGHEAGIKAVIHPGGSVKDQDSIDYCNSVDMAMVMTGNRHFKH